ncbi:hypothetical protein [Sphaerisporangium corydalis]|uniref:DUF4352 domain-containing protein n=1 Tax=Sphaerisporangium corydalis TaxID=1441875 RepID=A0ABV9EMI3_9ACTN|nr:hypothetical protein [Sphaerisporangium corydalis]
MSETNGAGAAPASFDAFKPVAREAPAPGEESIFSTGSWPAVPPATLPPAPPEPPARPRRLRRAARAVVLLVTAVALVAVTIGVQVWDRSVWVGARYPAEVVTDVPRLQGAPLHGMTWRADLSVRPRALGDDPGVTSVVATVEVTPASAEQIAGYLTPDFEMRDRTGRRWQALPSGTLTQLDLRAGMTSRLTVVATVPNAVRDTAELVLAYSPREMLRFAR